MVDCIFCKIARKEIAAKIVWEDGELIAFNDVSPLAPVHVLIIPKQHIASVNDLEDAQTLLAGKMILAAKQIAAQLGIAKDGYKLLLRTGSHGGQEVGHIHLHLIGGAPLREDIGPASRD